MPSLTYTTWRVKLLYIMLSAHSKQEDFTRVNWTLYTTKSPTIFNPTESLNPQGQLESLPYVENDETLEEAANELRRRDFYSLFDVTSSAVWVFQILGHTSDDHGKKRQSDLAQLINYYSLISEPYFNEDKVRG